MSKEERPAYFVPALEKGLDVVEALASTPIALTLTELARTLDRSSSVLFRITDALEKRGYIVRDPVSGAYRLTLKLYELAHTHSPVDHLLRAATFPMRELADSIHESCHLSVLAHGKLVVVAEELSPDRVRISVEVGSQINPIPYVSGRVLISFLADDARSAFLDADSDYKAMSRARRRRLHSDLREIRRLGYTTMAGARGTDLAVIVGNPEVGVAAALGIPFLAGGKNHGREKDTLPAVRKCADRITRGLGLTPSLI